MGAATYATEYDKYTKYSMQNKLLSAFDKNASFNVKDGFTCNVK